MSRGKICYLEIAANTAEASAQFYSSIFGWKVRTRGDGELAFDDLAARNQPVAQATLNHLSGLPAGTANRLLFWSSSR